MPFSRMASLATIALAVAAFGVTGYLPAAHAAQVSALISLVTWPWCSQICAFSVHSPVSRRLAGVPDGNF